MVGQPIIIMLTPPQVILFDWHATLVDTFDAMYHAIDDVLRKFHNLGLLKRMTKPEDSKNIEDARLVEYVRTYKKLHPRVTADQKISRTDIFEVLFDTDEDAKEIAHIEFNKCYRDHFGEIHPFEEGIDTMNVTYVVLRGSFIEVAKAISVLATMTLTEARTRSKEGTVPSAPGAGR